LASLLVSPPSLTSRSELTQLSSIVLNVTSCTDSSTSLACLRALPYETYYSALVNSSYSPAPIPDGDFILQSPVKAIKQGQVVNKNMLISATRDEATCEFSKPR